MQYKYFHSTDMHTAYSIYCTRTVYIHCMFRMLCSTLMSVYSKIIFFAYHPRKDLFACTAYNTSTVCSRLVCGSLILIFCAHHHCHMRCAPTRLLKIILLLLRRGDSFHSRDIKTQGPLPPAGVPDDSCRI